MKVKSLLTKSLLVAAGLCVGANSAWADDAKTQNFSIDLSQFDGYGSGSYADGVASFKLSQYGWAKLDLSSYYEQIEGTITNVKITLTENVGSGGRQTIGVFGNNKTSWASRQGWQDTGNSVTVWGIMGRDDATRIYYGSTYASGVTLNAATTIEVDMDVINKKFTWKQGGTTKIDNQSFVDTEISLPQYLALYTWVDEGTATTLTNMDVTVTYLETSYYTATFNESNGLNPAVTIYSNAERTSKIANGLLADNTTYYYTASLANYYDYKGSFAVSGENPTVNFTMTQYPSYTVNAVSGGSTVAQIATGYAVEDATFGVYLPYAILGNDGKYYTLDDESNAALTGFYASYTMGSSNTTKEINYALDESIKAFYEGENMSKVGHAVYNTRSELTAASGGKAITPYSGTDNGIQTNSKIAQGVYNISIAVNRWADLSTSYTFQYSTDNVNWTDIETVTFAATSNETHVSENVQIPGDSYLRLMSPGGTPRHSVDYILVQKVGELVTFTLGAESGDSYKSFITTGNTDFATLGVTAYIAKAADTENGTVTLSTIDNAPANIPVLLKGVKGSTAVISTTSTSYSAPETNYLAAANNTAISSSEAKYVLAYSDKWEFRHYNGTLSAGKVYLDLSALGANAATLSFVFEDETTGISAVEELREKDGQVYNLSGQRVNQPTKGLYIVNGKKYIAK